MTAGLSVGEPAWQLCDALRRVSCLEFEARGNTWAGKGLGSVAVETTASGVLVFNESGSWRPEQGRDIPFRNTFRWSAIDPQIVRLEHLRFGPDHPVHLFDLTPDAESWRSVRPHR
jgi:hypothetical protein